MNTIADKPDKRADYAKILTSDENKNIWRFLEEQYGINPDIYKNFGFAQSKKGRMWIGSQKALEFIAKDKLDPAKVLTVAMGKADSKKLLSDTSMMIRLTLDGALFFNTSITKNIIKLTQAEEKQWSAGGTLERTDINNGVYIISSTTTGHIIGSTVVKEGKLLNFVPKWRRFPRPT